MPSDKIKKMKRPNPQHSMALVRRPQHSMALIRQLRSYASELSQANLKITTGCKVSQKARDNSATVGVFIATALSSLATAEADTREAAIRVVIAEPDHDAINLVKSYLAAAYTVITNARLLLAEAEFNLSRAAKGRVDIVVPHLPDASLAA